MPVQFPAVIELSSLNGQNGFAINGINLGDWSGWSVASAGDVNDDGIQDIIIGAPQIYSSAAGKTYVVFGKANWTSPISLSTLNGTNGFELDEDCCGTMVNLQG